MTPDEAHKIGVAIALIVEQLLKDEQLSKDEQLPGAFDYWPAEEEGNWGDA